MALLTKKQKEYRAKKKLSDKLYRIDALMKQKQKRLIETSQKKALNQSEKIKNKITLEKDRKTKKYQKLYEQEIKNIEREEKGNKKVVYKKKPKGLKYYKDKAFDVFQLYIRTRDCNDENGYGIMIDKEEYRNVKGCHGGHFFGKHNYPHMIFNEDNCHAQTSGGNRQQLDKVGLFYEDRIIERIGQERYDKLREISRDKGAKERAKRFGKEYFMGKTKEYTEKLKQLKEARNII